MSSRFFILRASLTKKDIDSLIKLCSSKDTKRVDTHGGRKVALKYLLNIHSIDYDLSSYNIDSNQWNIFENEFNQLKKFDLFKKEFYLNNDQSYEPYWELSSDS